MTNSPYDIEELDEAEEVEEDPFGDCFSEVLDEEKEEVGEDGEPVEFSLECPHGEKIERKKVFGFVNYVHQSDGKPCELCNKFNLKSSKVSDILADGVPRSIRDDAYRANLLTSPKKRKEYLTWVSKLPMIEFLAEIKLLDRYIQIRHGVDHTPYKLGSEVFKAFGKDFLPVVDYLFPNTEYEHDSVLRAHKYYRTISYTPPKFPISCLSEIEALLMVRTNTEDAIRSAELGLAPGTVVVGQTTPTTPPPTQIDSSSVVIPLNGGSVLPAPKKTAGGAQALPSTHPAIRPNPQFRPRPTTP